MHISPQTRNQNAYNTVSSFVSTDVSQPATDLVKFENTKSVSRAESMLYNPAHYCNKQRMIMFLATKNFE